MKFKKMSPNLMVSDVQKTVEFYINILGFELAMAVPVTQDSVLMEIKGDQEIVYAQVKNDEIEIMFQAVKSMMEDLPATDNTAIGGSMILYFEIEDVKEYYGKIKDKVDVIKDLNMTWYGMNEFYIRDINGYFLAFSERNE